MLRKNTSGQTIGMFFHWNMEHQGSHDHFVTTCFFIGQSPKKVNHHQPLHRTMKTNVALQKKHTHQYNTRTGPTANGRRTPTLLLVPPEHLPVEFSSLAVPRESLCAQLGRTGGRKAQPKTGKC